MWCLLISTAADSERGVAVVKRRAAKLAAVFARNDDKTRLAQHSGTRGAGYLVDEIKTATYTTHNLVGQAGNSQVQYRRTCSIRVQCKLINGAQASARHGTYLLRLDWGA